MIAHSVSVMTVQAGAVRRLLLPEQERERQALEIVESTGREALTEMRRLVGLLREHGTMPEFAPQPSLRTLDVLIGTVSEAGLEVDLEIAGRGAGAPAGRRPLRVPARPGGAHEHAQVRRPGAGLGHAALARRRARAGGGEQRPLGGATNGSGHGLAGMRERVALCGGTLETGPRDGGGFVVRCHLPLESPA